MTRASFPAPPRGDEIAPMPNPLGRCFVCGHGGWSQGWLWVISPSGREHLAHPDNYGMTYCGKDAGRHGWWWPE